MVVGVPGIPAAVRCSVTELLRSLSVRRSISPRIRLRSRSFDSTYRGSAAKDTSRSRSTWRLRRYVGESTGLLPRCEIRQRVQKQVHTLLERFEIDALFRSVAGGRRIREQHHRGRDRPAEDRRIVSG